MLCTTVAVNTADTIEGHRNPLLEVTKKVTKKACITKKKAVYTLAQKQNTLGHCWYTKLDIDYFLYVAFKKD